MSSLLGEAIVDAKALRESALKNAESTIIEKYSDEVKKTLEQLLEQEEDAMGLAGEEAPDLAALPEEPLEETGDPTPVTEDDIPLAATDDLSGSEGQNLSDLPKEGEEVEVTIDLGALQESIEELAKTLSEDEEMELDLNEEDSKPDYIDLDKDGDKDEPMKKAAKDAKEKKEEIDEEIDIDPSAEEEEADDKAMSGLANLDEDGSDALVDAVMEKLTVDMGFELSGWAGRPTSQLRQGQEMELAAEQSTDRVEEEAELDKKLEESLTVLEGENNSLKEQLDKYKQAVEEIKENLYEVNLSNARLLYTNRVLRNTSLNERQKDKIVEAISSAGSVTEAKTIFETLQSTVEAKPKRSPKSLGEAISGRSSVIRATRQESTQPTDAFSDRMRRLAGIK
jgi:hypothetical protein